MKIDSPRFLPPIVLLLAAFVFGACSDAVPSAKEHEDARTPDRPIPTDDAGVDARPATGPQDAEVDGPPPPPVAGRELEIVGERNRLVNFGATADLSLRYFQGNQRVAVPNSQIALRLFDEAGVDRTAEGISGTLLNASNGRTNAEGQVTFRIRAGERVGDQAGYTLRVQARDPELDCEEMRLRNPENPPAPNECVASIEWQVTIAPEGAGGLTVRVLYDPAVNRHRFADLSSAEVKLFDTMNCATLASNPQDLFGAYQTLPIIRPFNEIDNQTAEPDLEDGARFSVTAIVRNNNLGEDGFGHVVAFGCADAVTITGGSITEVDVEAMDLPLEFKGVYTVVSKFDLTDLLRSSNNNTLNTVADVLDVFRILGSDDGERGQAIVRLFCDLVNLDDGVCNTVRGIAGRVVDRLIERLFDEWIPPIVRDILYGISDVLTIVSEMTVIGEIEFTQPTLNEENQLLGNDNRWRRFRFTWRNGCMQQPCTREFTIGQIDPDRRGAIHGGFDADFSEGRLNIGAHGINFRWGLIVLGVAQQWIIPAILRQPGPVGFEEMLSTLLPCAEIDNFIGINGLCEDILVAALSDIVYELLGNLEFAPEQFSLEGSTVPQDDDGDLRIDSLRDGIWRGNIDLGNTVLQFNGCFVGCRGAEECPAPLNDCVIPNE